MYVLSELGDWYAKQCVDEWQEEYGDHIDTLDNPGWSVKIDLVRTALQDKPFQEVKFERSEHDWITASRNAKHFEAFGGPNNLHEMIEIFLSWVSATETV
ncbi:MAG: immunity 53 family protein [Alphaproteobacteria bacterium]|nr:immunity 53 family protein [Alphaproteobacteria bacterium]